MVNYFIYIFFLLRKENGFFPLRQKNFNGIHRFSGKYPAPGRRADFGSRRRRPDSRIPGRRGKARRKDPSSGGTQGQAHAERRSPVWTGPVDSCSRRSINKNIQMCRTPNFSRARRTGFDEIGDLFFAQAHPRPAVEAFDDAALFKQDQRRENIDVVHIRNALLIVGHQKQALVFLRAHFSNTGRTFRQKGHQVAYTRTITLSSARSACSRS